MTLIYYLSVCNVQQLVVPYNKHGFCVGILYASSSSSALSSFLLLFLAKDYVIRPLHTISCVDPRRRIGHSQVVHNARARWAHSYTGFQSDIAMFKLSKFVGDLTPPPSPTGVITRTACFWGLIKTCILPTASALMGLVPISKNNTDYFRKQYRIVDSVCVISVK